MYVMRERGERAPCGPGGVAFRSLYNTYRTARYRARRGMSPLDSCGLTLHCSGLNRRRRAAVTGYTDSRTGYCDRHGSVCAGRGVAAARTKTEKRDRSIQIGTLKTQPPVRVRCILVAV